MLAMFPDHTNRHYAYLRDSQPDLVPHLDIEKGVIELDHKKTDEEGKNERMKGETIHSPYRSSSQGNSSQVMF